MAFFALIFSRAHAGEGVVCASGGQAQAEGLQNFSIIGQFSGGHIMGGEELCSLAGYVPRVFQPSQNPANADLDEDGLPMVWERTYGLNEFVDDSSADVDMDGLSNLQEFNEGTSPTRTDTDLDGLSDYEEIQQYNTDPTKMDSDGDGYIDSEEVAQGTDPLDDSSNPGVVQASALLNPFRRLVGAGARSVGGGLSSFFASGYTGAEQTATNGSFSNLPVVGVVAYPFSSNPQSWDTDEDGLPDSWEITYGIEEQIANAGNDTDGDGLTNLQEYTLNTNPLLEDTDGDGLGDYEESQTHGTNPLLADGDGDGVSDAEELAQSTNPNDDSDYPGSSVATYQSYTSQISSFGKWAEESGGGIRSYSLGGSGISDPLTSNDGHISLAGMIYSLHEGDAIIEADVDNDQMPDAWERAVVLNPLVDDADLDTDGDGLTNLQEYALATEPKIADSDGDGLSDGVEVSQHNSNPLKTDSDGDGYSDGEEVSAGYVPTQAGNYPGWQADISPYTSLAFSLNDWSGWVQTEGLNSFALVGQPYQAGIANGTTGQLRSGFVSLVEPAAGSGTSRDSDGDGLPDVWESIYGFDPLLVDSSSDLDGDGLNELKEFQKGTHPNLADTDGDGLSDREETENYDTDPTLVDTDGDGYEDAEELSGGYSPTDDSEYPGWNVVVVNYVDALNAQASGGGRATASGLISYSLTGTFAAPPMVGNAGFSSLHGFIYLANPPTGDPREVDSDGDGLPDVWELANGANPVLVDAGEDGDEDGLSNLQEFDAGTDPRNSDSDEDGLSDGEEILSYSTNPLLIDTDGDGYEDGEEVEHASSPSDANSIPAYANPKNYLSFGRSFSTTGGSISKGEQFVGSSFSAGVFANDQNFNLHGFYYQVLQPEGSPENMDSDGDGMPDVWESTNGLDPTVNDATGDRDGDGLSNLAEYTNQTDPNLWDTDGDDLSDGMEVGQLGSDPNSMDSDGDGYTDYWEVHLGYSPSDPEVYPGHDLVSYKPAIRQINSAGAIMANVAYASIFTIGQSIAPTFAHGNRLQAHNGYIASLGDVEVDLLSSDVDEDGVPDYWEEANGLSVTLNDAGNDSDADGLTNLVEWEKSTHPYFADTDGDGLGDNTEVSLGTDPNLVDTDLDGFEDGEEVESDSDPLLVASFPGWDDPVYVSVEGIVIPSSGASTRWVSTVGQSFGQSANFNSGYANHSGFLPRIYTPVSNLKTLDSDGDGMPDAWEKIYSFDLFTNDSAADLDGDGLSNGAEFLAGTLPNHADTDADGLSDGEEINQYDGDPLEKDTDGDGYEDFEEAQANSLLDDNSSFPGSNLTKYGYRGAVINTGGGWADNNFYSIGHPLSAGVQAGNNVTGQAGFLYAMVEPSGNPASGDADGDGLPDFWEQLYGLNIFENDAEEDGDSDGVINAAEFEAGSSPISADTDGDGLADGEEISTHGSDPTKEDSDEDGFSDSEEIAQGFDPLDGERYPQWNWGDKNYSSPVRWVDAGGGKLSNAYSSLGHAISDYWASSNQYINFSGGYARLFNAPSFPSADVDEDGMPDAWERIYQFDVTENNASEDSDEDGLTNIQEYALGLNPLIADTDEDGLLDGVEVNDHKTNPLLKDSDADGFEDAEEIESGTSPNNQEVYPGYDQYPGKYRDKFYVLSSSSGWTASREYASFGLAGQPIAGIIAQNQKVENRSGWVPIISTEDVDPNQIDTDGDELPDVWENAYGFDPMVEDAAGDRDEDGLTNLEELAYFTSPLSTDTDGDGLTDYEEVKELNTDPTSEDGDGDGYSDAEEIEEGTDPNREDRYPGWDFVLVNYGHKSFLGSLGGWTGAGSSPTFASVGDFRSVAVLTNAQNINISGFLHENFGDQQNPNLLDSDGDGLPDAWERIHGFSMVLDDAEDDLDEDGLSAIQEYALSTNPLLADSDGDGLSDGAEINDYQSNPLLEDSDEDGFSDAEEVEEGSDPADMNSLPASAEPKIYLSGGGETVITSAWIENAQNHSFGSAGSTFSPHILSNENAVLVHSFIFSMFPPSQNLLTHDSDSDGLPDSWERVNHLDLTLNDTAADPDGDLLSNFEEFVLGTNPILFDSDEDGLGDGIEVNTYSTDPLSLDSDEDGFDDAEEVLAETNASDAARYPGWYEDSLSFTQAVFTLNSAGSWGTIGLSSSFSAVGQVYGGVTTFNHENVSRAGLIGSSIDSVINPSESDQDSDEMPDLWEIVHGMNPEQNDADLDADGDGLSNRDEYLAETDPNEMDTDEDGLSDAEEVNLFKTNPNLEDSDDDGFSDLEETNANSNPTDEDSFPGSEPLPVYISVFSTTNSGGGSQVGNRRFGFYSLGQGFDGGMLKNDFQDAYHGFTFITNPSSSKLDSFDSDGDTISDIEERIITTDELVSDVNVDYDSDGLSNFREYQLGTDLYSQDSDEDGLSDYKEVEELLTNPLVEDSDGDGYSDGDESSKGTDPLSESSFPGLQLKTYYSYIHTINGGGVYALNQTTRHLSAIGQVPEATIIRRSDTEMRSGFLPFWGNIPDPNFAPFNLASTANLEILENAPVGTFVGLFVAEDQDEDAQLSFYLDTEIEDGNHSHFALDENGTLTSNASFDYENNATEITLQVYVLDERKGRAEANFVVTILDMFEDMDQDGVEDHLDEDMDGDGFTNEEELAYPSDPEDPTSMANVPPLQIHLDGNLSVLENEPVSTIVGEINATDPDGDEVSFRMHAGYDDFNQSLFVLEENGTLKTAVTFDYESNSTSYQITIEVIDEHNATLEQNVTISILDVDDTPPVIVLLGDSNVTHEAGGAYVDVNASWSDLVDGSGEIVGVGEVNASLPGTYVINFDYTDNAGNDAVTVTRTVHVVDTSAPVIVLNGDSNVTHEAGGGYVDANASWSDLVDGSGEIAGVGEVNASLPGTYVLNFDYTDNAGNDAVTVTRTVHVVDTSAPVIVLNGDSNVTHEAGGTYVDANASWSDLVDGSGEIAGVGEVNASLPGTYVLNFDYTDNAGNDAATVTRTVHVVDTSAPVIVLNGDSNVTHEAGETYVDANASWSDLVDGSGEIVGEGEVNASLPGTYVLSFDYTDNAGNAAVTVNRTIHVVDTTVPEITLNGILNVSHEVGNEYHDSGATWTDLVDGFGVVSPVGEVNVMIPGTYTLIYNYTDSAGNDASPAMRTVQVVDTTAPVIVLNGDSNVTHEAGEPYVDANASWSDLVDGSGEIAGVGEVNASLPGTYVINFDFTDNAGNAAQTVSRVIHVVDTIAPEITLIGDAFITHEAGLPYFDENASWTDAVDGSGMVVGEGEVDSSRPGTYELNFSYSDHAGNVAVSLKRIVQVVDTTAPDISLIGDHAVIHSIGSVYFDDGATWYDAVDGEGPLVASNNIDTSILGIHTLHYSKTDAAGNKGEANRTVEVINPKPRNLSYEGELSILENQSVGTLVATFDAENPNGNNLNYFLMTDDSIDHQSFKLEQNGTLVTAHVLDFERNASRYHIRVLAKNEYNASVEGNFTVTLLNVVEDNDGDGTEDYYDPDDDNDGFYDVEELAYPSDPFDPDSLANTDPHEIVGPDSISVVENVPLGTEVCQFVGADVDEDEVLSYSLVTGLGYEHNHLFTIDENGTLQTAKQIDYETYTELSIRVRTTDPHGAHFEERFLIEVIDLDEDVPVLTLLGEANITHGVGFPFFDPGASWTDKQDGGGMVYTTTEFSATELGTFTLVYEFTDGGGNSAIPLERTVVVVDKTNPELSLIGDTIINYEGGPDFVDPGARWTDNIDGNGTVYSSDLVNARQPGFYSLEYQYIDAGGNEAKISRTVMVQDTSLPILTLLGDAEIRLTVWTDFIDPWVEAYDAVDGNLSDRAEVIGEVRDDLPGEYDLAYVLTDSSGNLAQAVTRKVIVENRAPVGITLDINQTEENQPAGTYVGQLITTDPDDPQGERFYSYQLLEDDENTSSALFSVDSTGQVFTEGSLDYETESYYTIRVRTRDQFGGEYEQEIGIEVLDSTIPIVHTELPVFESGSLRLGGEIGHRGGLEPVIRSGVVVSGEPIRPGMLGTDKVQEFDILLERNASEYSALIGLEKITARDAGNLYVMAYAENTEGRAYGLEERINITPRALEQDDWTGARALENREGWWNSSWFGTYYRSEESGWLLHLELGWMYPAPGTNRGLWLWKENLNWLWTDSDVFPFLYSSDSGNWLYFFGDFNRKRLLYDYGLQKWMTLDEREVDEEEGAR